MGALRDQIVLVTGASSGIGRAIALGLASHGAWLCLVGRSVERLEAVAQRARTEAQRVLIYSTDLTSDENIEKLRKDVERDCGYIDILIHSAGAISQGKLQSAPVTDLDLQYAANLRAPYVLTQVFLPMLISRRGQIVFVNSSVGLSARANVGQFASTQHALRALADSLRDEVNAEGIRVLSVFPGRTATPRQARIFAMEGTTYHPELLLQPEDVASVVIHALALPRTAEVTNISIRPMLKTY